jgi:hypothetical protein
VCPLTSSTRHGARLAHTSVSFAILPCATMASSSLLLTRSVTDDGVVQHPKALTRSPPPSPKADFKSQLRGPYPISSNNPASQYTLLDKLGTGSFGTVFKAIHNETKQIVAIKQIGTFSLLDDCPLHTHHLFPHRFGRHR